MKRWIKITFIVLAQLIIVLHSCEAASFSQTYKLTVTIPAIVGINVPAPQDMVQNKAAAIQLAKNNVASNMPTEVVVSQGLIGKQKVTFQTLVVK